MLQKSLNRISSGMKIVQPSDDAGGLAVSMKLSATINRTSAISTNITNAQSFLQTQDGAFQVAGNVMDRISELKILANDVTKNHSDIANYETEFSALQEQLMAISPAKPLTVCPYSLLEPPLPRLPAHQCSDRPTPPLKSPYSF